MFLGEYRAGQWNKNVRSATFNEGTTPRVEHRLAETLVSIVKKLAVLILLKGLVSDATSTSKNGVYVRGWWLEPGGMVGGVEWTRIRKHLGHVSGSLLSASTPMYSYPNIPRTDTGIRCYNPACTRRFKDDNARGSHIDRKPECHPFYTKHLDALRSAAIL